ncbi:MAG: hypothetical protein RR921_08005 [Mucinivorans sp.]
MMNTNPSCISSADDEILFQKSKAIAALELAKRVNQERTCELRIDDRTRIMVTKENFNRAYAEKWKANHENCKLK